MKALIIKRECDNKLNYMKYCHEEISNIILDVARK